MSRFIAKQLEKPAFSVFYPELLDAWIIILYNQLKTAASFM
jgi:hypothetical protein